MYQVMNHPDVMSEVPDAETAKVVGYFGIGAGIVGGLFGTAIWFFIAAAIYKVIMMFMSNDTSYMKLLSIYVYTYTISILGAIVNFIIRMILGGDIETSYTSLATLFERYSCSWCCFIIRSFQYLDISCNGIRITYYGWIK